MLYGESTGPCASPRVRPWCYRCGAAVPGSPIRIRRHRFGTNWTGVVGAGVPTSPPAVATWFTVVTRGSVVIKWDATECSPLCVSCVHHAPFKRSSHNPHTTQITGSDSLYSELPVSGGSSGQSRAAAADSMRAVPGGSGQSRAATCSLGRHRAVSRGSGRQQAVPDGSGQSRAAAGCAPSLYSASHLSCRVGPCTYTDSGGRPEQPPITTQRLPLPWRHLGHRIPLPHSNTVEYGWTLREPSLAYTWDVWS